MNPAVVGNKLSLLCIYWW